MSVVAPMTRPSEVLRTRRDVVLSAVRAHGVLNPRIIGSEARGTDTPQSDVDLVVTVPRGSALSFLSLGDYLTDLLGVHVDVVSDGGLSETSRTVLDEAVPL